MSGEHEIPPERQKALEQYSHASYANVAAKQALETLRKIDVDFLLEDATKDSIRLMEEVVENTERLFECASARWHEEEA